MNPNRPAYPGCYDKYYEQTYGRVPVENPKSIPYRVRKAVERRIEGKPSEGFPHTPCFHSYAGATQYGHPLSDIIVQAVEEIIKNRKSNGNQ